jgi:hypothetical protein
MKKKMAEQAKKDAEEEEAEDSGMNISWLLFLQNYLFSSHSPVSYT